MALNFNATTPAAPAGSTNVNWQNDASGNASAYTNAFPAVQTELALTGQTGNVSPTNLVASVPNNARYRVTAYIIITTPGSISSTLPSVVLAWTDADNTTIQSQALTATSAGNTDTTQLSGTWLISASATTSISISTTGYASNAAGMVYSLYVETELV